MQIDFVSIEILYIFYVDFISKEGQHEKKELQPQKPSNF